MALTADEHARAYHVASQFGINASNASDRANAYSRAAYHMEKAVKAGHEIYGQENVKKAHERAAGAYKDFATGIQRSNVPSAEASRKVPELKKRTALHKEAASSGKWDEDEHPRDENGKFTVTL